MDNRTGETSAPPVSTTDPARERQVRRWRRLTDEAGAYVAGLGVVPPFPLADLLRMADELARSPALEIRDAQEQKLLAILIHNAAWRDTVAAVPFDRRLLLLPQCLRPRDGCLARTDAYGLLCRECGRCPLGRLQREAVERGYVVLIAEGTSAVTGLLKDGAVEAVIGASCLPALEQSFREIAEEAVPALAVPLLRDGCQATDIDVDLLSESIGIRTDAPWRRTVAVEDLRHTVQGWFAPEALDAMLPPGNSHAGGLAREWLAGSGKRWRPLLAAAVHDALRSAPDTENPDAIRCAAVAAECFHKASLIHDDIEDGDDLRQGRPTLHRAHGLPVALNVGDLLLGEGYRLLASCPVDPSVRVDMLAAAADGHRRLCMGQGEELQWKRQPKPLGAAEVLALFALKTSPAFEVALLLGALAGGAGPDVRAALVRFSHALGIAYQVRDDLLDRQQDTASRPSILLGLLCDACTAEEREAMREGRLAMPHALEGHGIAAAAEALQAEYRERALQALAPIRSVRLKSVLSRLVRRILPA